MKLNVGVKNSISMPFMSLFQVLLSGEQEFRFSHLFLCFITLEKDFFLVQISLESADFYSLDFKINCIFEK